VKTHSTRFVAYAWFVVAFTIGVILWGAVVRATGSGAGCGSHWPTCNGEVLPELAQMETMIEFVHRITSALSGVLVIGLLVWAYRLPKKNPLARRMALLSFIFILIEGFIGMLLVRLELVADNASVLRAVAIGLHLVNTYILLAFMVLTAWAGGREPGGWRWREAAAWLMIVGLVAMSLLSAAGAVTALGDTLFPMAEMRQGAFDNLDPTAQFLVDLRVIHPVLAIFVSAFLVGAGRWLFTQSNAQAVRRLVVWLMVLVAVQLAAGVINIVLAAPVWMQMLHLLLADLLWIVMILLTAEVLTAPATAPVETREGARIERRAA
jgi:heme A synthase